MKRNLWARWLARLLHPRTQAARRRKARRPALEPLEARLAPATDVWTGGGVNGNWSLGTNWNLGRAPQTGDALVFGSATNGNTTTVNNIAAVNGVFPTYGSITFDASGYTLSGNQLNLAGNLTAAANTTGNKISLTVGLTAASTWTVNTLASLDMAGTLTGPSAATLTKQGTGTLELDGANTAFLGAVDDQAGVIVITNASALGSGASHTTVETNAQLQLSNVAKPIAEPLLLNGQGINDGGALLNVAGNNTWSGTITLDSDSVFGALVSASTGDATDLTITGQISDNAQGHNVTKVGDGTVTFAHPGGDTYRGTTTINAGILAVEDPLSLGAGAEGSTSGSPQNETIVNDNTATGEAGTLELLFNPTTFGTSYAGDIDPNGVLTNPALPFNAKTNPYVGFQVFNELLVLNGPGSADQGALSNENGDNIWGGSVILGSPSPNNAGFVYVGAAATSTNDPNTDLNIEGVVSSPNGSTELDKVDDGRVILSNANTYTGDTDVVQGILNIRDSEALGAATNAVTVNDGSTLEMQVDSGLDGTALSTHGRNLGHDSVTTSGFEQTVTLTGTSGTVALKFTNPSTGTKKTTAAFSVTDPTLASDLQAALSGLSNFPTGASVTVTQAGGVLHVVFGGSLTGLNVPLLATVTTGAAAATVTSPGQELYVTGTTGSFNLTFINPVTGVSATTKQLNVASTTLLADITAALAGLTNMPAGAFTVTQTGSVFRVEFGGSLAGDFVPLLTAATTGNASVSVTGVYGLTVSNPIGLSESGTSINGALHSISGINVWAGNVTLSTPDDLDGVSVDADSRPGHPTADSSYFSADYSLAVTGPITSATTTTLLKLGTGQLIIPGANAGLQGPTLINAGWITIQNDDSLGLPITEAALGPTVQPDVITVDSGAALQLKPLLAGSNLSIGNNMILGGTGVTNAFGLIDQEGAVEALGGLDTLTGNIQLNGNAGLGAELVSPGSPSQLTVTGATSNYIPPPLNLSFDASGGAAEQRFLIDTGGTSGTITVDYDMFSIPDDCRVYYPPEAQGGTLIYDTGDVSNTGTFTVTYGPGTSTFIEIVMNEGGGLSGTAWSLDSVVIKPNTGGTGGITKLGSQPVILQGPGSYSGAVNVAQGTLQVANNTALGQDSSGTATTGNETYTATTTTVGAGAVLQLGSDVPATDGGIQGGAAVANENLVLDGAGQQITVTGVSSALPSWAATFTLSFTNPFTGKTSTSGSLNVNSTTLLADIQAALNALVPTGATATVSQSGDVFTVTYGGTLLSALAADPATLLGATNTGGDADVLVSGGIASLQSLGEDNLWQGAVTLAGSAAVDVSANGRLSLAGNIDDSTNTGTTGSSLSKLDAGELLMAGNNTYRGNTYISGGLVTISSNTALGAPSVSDVQTVTVSGNGTFSLSFDGSTTSTPLSTGSATLASDIQSALDLLPSISGAGGSVSVSGSGPVYTVTFDGGLAGSNQPQMTSAKLSGTASAVVGTLTGGYGQVVVDSGAQLQLSGSLAVAGKALSVQGTGVATANNVPLQWDSVGPSPIDGAQTPNAEAATGRVTGLATDPTDPNVIYLSSAGGGAWKTIDGGHTWVPLFDGVSVVQTVTVPSGTGTFTLTYAGSTTGSLSDDATALQVQAAINGLASVVSAGGSVTVTQQSAVYTVTFSGGAFADVPLAPTGTVQTLTATGATVAVVTKGATSGVALFSGAIAVAPTDPSIIYLGTGEANNSGDSFYGTGVYESKDGGVTWSLLTDANGSNPLDGTAVAEIVVDPSNANLIYVATSDLPVNDATQGSGNAGVWRFGGAGGKNWYDLTGFTSQLRQEGAVKLYGTTNSTGFPDEASPPTAPPNSPGPDDDWRVTFPDSFASYSGLQLFQSQSTGENVLYIALGTSFGDLNNGVYRCMNPATASGGNGAASTAVWFVGDGNPLNSSGQHTYDQGGSDEFPVGDFTTFTPLYGRIALGIDPTDAATDPGATFPQAIGAPTGPNTLTIIAPITDPNSGALLQIEKSTNGGQTWSDVGGPPNYMSAQGWYDTVVQLTNANTIYVAGSAGEHVYESTDGGTAWTDITTDINGNGPHADDHAIAVDASGDIIEGNDGGVWRYTPSATGVGTWADINGDLTLTTLKGADSAPDSASTILAGSQDNGTELYTGTNGPAWQWVNAGDGGAPKFDPLDANIAYGSADGFLQVSTDGGMTWSGNFQATGGLYFPIAVDSLNSDRVVFGGDGLFESMDQGTTINEIDGNFPASYSGEVTAVAIAEYQGTYQFDSGFPLVTDQGANTYDENTIYVTDGSALLVTKDHGQSWADRTDSKLATALNNGFIQDIEVDPRDRDDVYAVTQGAPGSGGNQVLFSSNAGQTWTELNTSSLPDIPFWKLAVDPRSGTLYLGTDNGVYTLTGGVTSNNPWAPFSTGLPAVQVTDVELNLNTNTLTAATYGRGVYTLTLDNETANSGALLAIAGASTWTGPVTLTGPTTIGVTGSQSLQNQSAAASLDIYGVVNDQAAANGSYPLTNALTKSGDGTLVLSGSNTYGGLTTVAQGVILVDNPQALGGTTNGTVVDAGASLELDTSLGSAGQGEQVTLNGDGVAPGLNGHNTGALLSIGGNNVDYGNVTLTAGTGNPTNTIGVDSGSTLTLDGVVSGGGSAFDLVKEGAGTLGLAGADTFTGQTAVYQGALAIDSAKALDDDTNGVAVLDGAQVQLAGNVTVTGVPLVLSGTGIFDTGALLSTSGTDTWAGNITLTSLAGISPATLTSGVVALGADTGATLVIDGVVADASANFLDDGTAETLNSGGNEETGLAAVGPGTVVLQKANTYRGATYVQDGALVVEDPNALGNRTASEPTLPAVLQVALEGPNGLASGALTLGFGGGSQTLTWPSAATPAVPTAGEVKAALKALGITANVTRAPAGTVNMTQVGETNQTTQDQYVYTITVTSTLTGELTAAGSAGVSASASVVADGGIDVLVDAGAELDLDGATQPTGSLTVSGRTLTLNGDGLATSTGAGDGALHNLSGDNTWAGNITLATDSAVAADSGTSLTLSGALSLGNPLVPGNLTINPAPGALVDAGTVIFSAAGTFGQTLTTLVGGNTQVDGTLGNVTLDGGTLSGQDNGSGNVANLSSQGKSVIDPGDNYPAEGIGELTAAGNVTLTASDTFFVELGDPNSFASDQLQAVSGNVTLGNATLGGLIEPGVSIPVGSEYIVLESDGNGDVISGMFYSPEAQVTPTLASQGATSANIVFIDGEKFEVDYFEGSDPNAADQVVLIRELANATMSLKPSPASPSYSQPDTATVTLIPEVPTVPVTGNVTFTVTKDQGGALEYSGTAAINPATDVVTFDPNANGPLAPGNYTLTASYNGIDNTGANAFTPVTSTQDPFVVAPAPTTTTLTSSSPNPLYGQGFTLTAAVASRVAAPLVPGSQAPTGTVSFYLGSVSQANLLQTVSLVGNTATLNTATLSTPVTAGSDTIVAVYNGDTNYATSTSANFSQLVRKDGTTTTVVPLNSPSTYGQSVTFQATVTPAAPGGGFPTGNVTFKDNGLTLGSATLSTTAGNVTIATFTTTTPLPAGNDTITASYVGDGNFTVSSGTTTQVVNQDSTTLSVTSAGATVYGQSATFNVTVVSASGGAPTGTVTFYDLTDMQRLGAASLQTNAGLTTATFTTVPLALPVDANGTPQTIQAVYGGDNNFTGTSNTTLQTVTQDATVVAVTTKGTMNPSVYGQTVTITTTVAAATPGSGTPTGNVTLSLGNVTLGNATLGLLGGVETATFTTSAFQLPVGANQTISATYNGDTNFQPGGAGSYDQTVNLDPSTVYLTAAPSPLVYGQAVTLTARVVANGPGSGTPTGNVTFSLGNLTLGNGNLSLVNGQDVVTLTTNVPLAVGNTLAVTAAYNGDGNYQPSSGAATPAVQKDATTTSLSGSPAPSVYGQAVTYTATVTANTPGGGTPSGNVTFENGNVTVGVGALTLVGGVETATYTTTSPTTQLGVGNATITAVYSGDGSFITSSGSVNQVVGKDTTTVLAASSPSSGLVYGQPVTFTATVTPNGPGSGTPTGSVSFSLGNLSLGTVNLTLVGGVETATLNTNAAQLGVGAGVQVTATYTGDGNFISNSATLSQSVTRDTTAITVTAAPNPAQFGNAVTLTAVVTANTPGAGTPTGTVTFEDASGTPLGNGTLAVNAQGQDVASFSVAQLPGGNQTIQAVYLGDTNFQGSTGSGSVTVTPNATALAVQTTWSTTPANPVFGQPVTLTATITASGAGTTPPTGNVTFTDGNVTLGSEPVSRSSKTGPLTAVLVTTAGQLPAGNQTIVASYPGDGNFSASSGSAALDVVPDGTTLTASSLVPTNAVYGEPVGFEAVVTPKSPGAGTPTGNVTFSLGNVTLGNATLVANPSTGVTAAIFTTGATQLNFGGNQTITVTYAGDGNFTGSTGTVSQTIAQDATVTALSSSVNPSTIGQSVTFTAQVTAVAPGTGYPTGSVTFKNGNTTLGSASLTLVNGVETATYTPTPVAVVLGLGNQTITAVYAGNANYGQSSSTLTQSVTAVGTTTTLSSSLNPSTAGQSVTFTATVAANGSSANTPGGNVTFSVGGVTLGTEPLQKSGNSLTAVYTTTGAQLPVGMDAVTATYGGDSNFGGSTITIYQTVTSVGTTVSLASSAEPSVYGQMVTFTATVKPALSGDGNPSGTVTFTDLVNGSLVTLGQGVLTTQNGLTTAVLTTSARQLGVGSNQTITASYPGDGVFAAGNATLSQDVNPIVTATTVSVSENPAVEGQPLTLTATITPQTLNPSNLTGSVTFYVDNVSAGVANVSASTTTGATTATITLPTGLSSVGNHTFSASYTGDPYYNGSSSQTGSVTEVGTGNAADTTAVKTSAATALIGSPVTFTATVTAVNPGNGTPTGYVTFFLDSETNTPLGVMPLTGGTAALSTSTLPVGGHTIIAVYSGDSVFEGGNHMNNGSTSQVVVQPGARVTAANITPSPAGGSVYGQTVTFTVQMVDEGALPAKTPTGTVTFTDAATGLTLGSPQTLVAGGASVSTSALAVGTHDIVVSYGGDGTFAQTTSGGFSYPVSLAPTATSLRVSAASVLVGQAVTFTASVAATGAVGSPTGTVTFVDQTLGATLGSASVNGGIASLTYSGLGAGNHDIVAVYGGDGNFQGSASSGAVVGVSLATPAVGIVASTTNPNTPVTFTVEVASTMFGPNPTGTVSFLVDGVPQQGTSTLVNGLATFSWPGFTAGNHTVTVLYSGDANFAAASTTATFDFQQGRGT
jgi:autotransporter-associated beta strand protein